MVRLSNDEFLAGLTELFAAGTEKGSVYVTFKHHMDGETPVCLVRAVLGSTKSSTFVYAKDQAKFHRDYGVLLKNSMTALRKRDKKK